MTLRRILVGIDYSELGDRALQAALAMASASGDTEVHALYVAPGSADGPISRRDVGRIEVDLERLTSRLRQQLEVYRERFGEPPVPEVSAHRRTGKPAEELAQLAAELEAGLIVVGTHGRTGVERVVVGSVAEKVVRIAGCPVLVVRPIAHGTTRALPDAVEPPCPDCTRMRHESSNAAAWCERHAEHHPRAHVYGYKGPSSGASRPWGFS